MAGLENIALQLKDCEETEVLACCSHCGSAWYIVNHCRLRVCPLCSYKVAKERAQFLEAMCKDMSHPKMLTLTMPTWTENPRDGIAFLRKAFNKLRKRPLFKSVVGGAYNIELKPKDTGWHIHAHVLLDCKYIPYQQVFTEWKKIIGHNCPQIDIRAAVTKEARAYQCKYAVKASDFDRTPGSVVDWYLATKGTRLFTTFGKWYNVKIEELDMEGVTQESPPTCPHCNSEGTTFLARDGPFIYGHEAWDEVKGAMVGGHEEIRDIPEVKEYLDGSASVPF